MLYKHTTDTAYITEGGRKKNKQARTWVSSKCKKKEKFWHFSVVFSASVAIGSVYPSKILTQPPGTLTHSLTLADLASESTGPYSSLSNHLSLTVTFPQLLLTPSLLLTTLGPCMQDLCVGFVPKQIKESSDWHSPTETNPPPPPLCHKTKNIYIHKYRLKFLKKYLKKKKFLLLVNSPNKLIFSKLISRHSLKALISQTCWALPKM